MATSTAPHPDTSFEQGVLSLIQNRESNIQVIDAEISRLRSLVEDQARLRNLELDEISILRAQIASIRKLPVEILSDIFLLATVEADRRDIFRISHVSGHWREVAHNIPRLWATRVTFEPSDPSDFYLSMTKTWIDRSSPLPLPIHVVPAAYNSRLTTFFGVLLSVADRWGTVEMSPEAVQYFPPFPPGALTSLHTIFLRDPPDGKDNVDGLEIQAFSIAPRLGKVILQFADRNIVRVLHIPWAQLTEVELYDSPVSCRAILMACDRVEVAKFAIRHGSALATLPSKTLPRLKTLHATFNAMDSTVAAAFLNSFALPALESLKLRMSWNTMPWLGAAFTQFQIRAPKIQALTLTNISLDSNELIDVLRSALSLTHLTIEGLQNLQDEVFDALHYDAEVTPVVPKLRSFTFAPWQGHPVAFTSSTVSSMVRSRWWTDKQMAALGPNPPVARLRRLHFAGTFAADWPLRYNLRECIKQGFKLRLGT
ncbi:hypothetical protein C8R46DRAFT_137773 [Mycena filopes]|nr:hypothetical protein C8R46DRAFT_137773 [Mycena filopes]